MPCSPPKIHFMSIFKAEWPFLLPSSQIIVSCPHSTRPIRWTQHYYSTEFHRIENKLLDKWSFFYILILWPPRHHPSPIITPSSLLYHHITITVDAVYHSLSLIMMRFCWQTAITSSRYVPTSRHVSLCMYSTWCDPSGALFFPFLVASAPSVFCAHLDSCSALFSPALVKAPTVNWPLPSYSAAAQFVILLSSAIIFAPQILIVLLSFYSFLRSASEFPVDRLHLSASDRHLPTLQLFGFAFNF